MPAAGAKGRPATPTFSISLAHFENRSPFRYFPAIPANRYALFEPNHIGSVRFETERVH